MVSKYGRDSSDDDVEKEERDKSHRHGSKKDSRSDTRRDRRDEQNLAESGEIIEIRPKNRIERHDERNVVDEIRNGEDKARGEEDYSRVRDYRGRDDHQQRSDSRRSSDEYEKSVDRERDRRETKRSHRHENGHRKQEAMEGRRERDWRPRGDSEERDDGEGHKKPERERDRRGDDRHKRRRSGRGNDDDKQRREKDENEHREDHGHLREKGAKEVSQKGGDSKELENSKSQKLSDGNMNGNAANLGRSGGVYIPPFKLAQMMKEVEDKSSVEYQRLTWDALRKSINGLVNKVNATNIKNIIPELFAENLIRGRGLFCRSCMKWQTRRWLLLVLQTCLRDWLLLSTPNSLKWANFY